MTIQAMEKAIENLEYKVAKLEFEVYEQRRTSGQLIIEKADRKTEPQKWETPPKFEHKGIITTCVSVPACLLEDEPQRGCDADCNEDCTECAKEWQDWKDQMWTEAVEDEPQTDCAWQNDEHIPTELASTMLKNRFKEQK